ncbi:MAG: T9SS type A sorting domain-containing protein [Crocinitomicaceae bacterium]|nr:T9SS type A sorting domain-containing protein [Crocinitomicaceae bacterium]
MNLTIAMICLFKKNKLFLLVFLIAPFFLKGQITIDSTDFGVENDTVRISQAAPIISGYQSTGANYTWDFSSLTPQTQKLKDFSSMSSVSILINLTYGSFASSEYKASYFTESTDLPLDAINNFLPVDLDGLNMYYKLDSLELKSLGYSLIVDGQGIPFKSDTIETLYQLPLQYGQTYTGTGYTYIDLNPFSDLQFIQHRNRSSEVDGWGDLTTPFGSFSVLRVKHEIIEEDSVYQSFVGTGGWFALPTRIIKEYEWWAKGEKEPMLKIVANEISGNETVQSVEYKDIYRGLDASTPEMTSMTFEVYPNPAKGVLFYESILPIQKIQIKNLSGKTVYNKELVNSYKGNLIISELESGVYLMDIKTTKNCFTKRIIVR